MAYTAYGFDYTGGLNAATIDRATIDGHRIEFVCRYLSGFSKDLTPTEAHGLSAAGLSIVVVWETTATEAENGHAAGVADARAALAEAKRCGMPDGRPIYMAVDEDTVVGPHVSAYFQGVNSVLGIARTGVYGSYKVCKALHEAGLVTWMWQTYAWSAGQWYGPAQLQQYSNDHTIAGHGVDYDRATRKDYGQWRVGVSPSPKTQEDIEMIARDVLEGMDKKTQFPLAPGKFTTLVAGTDNSYKNTVVKATGPVQLRVRVLHTDGTWQAWEPTIGRAASDKTTKVVTVPIADPAHAVLVTVTRVTGDGTEPLTIGAY